MCEKLPAKSDFGADDDLDAMSACRHMLGKSKDEVRALLDDNYIRYQEDFMWMGPVAFCFYIDAMIGYITSAL